MTSVARAGTAERTVEDEALVTADLLRESAAYGIAVELYQWVLSRTESAQARFGLGQSLGKSGDHGGALQHLERAFALEPDRELGAGYLAYVLERRGRLREAGEWYERALAGPEADDLWIRSHHAWYLEKCGRTEEARAAYEDVLARNPQHTWTVKRYALMRRGLGDGEGARALLQDAVERAPGNKFAEANLLEYLLLTRSPDYPSLRASLATEGTPAWFAFLLELFDFCRDSLLPGHPDAERLDRVRSAADALPATLHRDFDDLTALLEECGADTEAWRDLLRRLVK
ncbi:tetratricopeptide repeat protein [Streptomyces bathyalis]|uniref:Tetratricopeptide repeat protein n=1 Tax=Streptomyces bathyalis TaxID=2710756 RepID=A0A7T1T9P1_9ACTN|nr:tetratricopeptide repeat protein [Streptomyces bathyalis]QPP08960.1 tetratricopeptide repeat protein [Streptomyces bathyalis]